MRFGVRRHLPFQVRLDARYAVDHALVLDVVAAEGTLGQRVPAQVDILGAGAEFSTELHLVELQPEAIGHHQHTVGEHPGVLLELRRDRRIINGQAVSHLDPGVPAVMAGHVDGFDGGDVLDLGDVGRTHHAQDLIDAGVHPGAVERRPALGARLGQQLADRSTGGVRMVGVAVPAGDPVGCRDDIDPRSKDFHVQVFVGEDAVEGEDIGFRGDDVVDRARGDDADRPDPGDLAGVASDLFRCVAMQSDQFEIGTLADALDHLGADVAGRHLEDANLGHLVSPSGFRDRTAWPTCGLP